MIKIKLKYYIYCIYYIFFFISISNNFFANLKLKKEFKDIEDYLALCSKNKKLQFNFRYIKAPKISVISPVHNQEKFILRFLRSLQNQDFPDIEILLIDDFSTDNIIDLIKGEQKKDKRIILIKNKKNRGTFIARNIGVLKSKGNYIILPDPDDILSKNSLRLFYNSAIKYNVEMVRFNIYMGKGTIDNFELVNFLDDSPICQPKLSSYIYYGLGKLKQTDFYVTNKLIKREAYIRALNLLKKYYLSLYMILYEDTLLNFILYRTAKSLYFKKNIGYYYILNNQSISTNHKVYKLIIKSIFINVQILLKYTKNSKKEKDMANLYFSRKCNVSKIINRFNFVNEENRYFYFTIKKFLKNEFLSINNKINLNNMMKICKYKRK